MANLDFIAAKLLKNRFEGEEKKTKAYFPTKWFTRLMANFQRKEKKMKKPMLSKAAMTVSVL